MAVRNWRGRRNEKIQFITPDGEVFNLDNYSNRMLLSMDGWGLPDTSISTTSGPYQHGETPTAIRELPRNISIRQRSQSGCRDDYWRDRGDLINALRRNRSDLNLPVPGSLKWYRSDNTIRQVDVFTRRGPKFTSYRNRHDPFAYEEQIDFIALNPIIYDPTIIDSISTGWLCTTAQQLTFPLTMGTVSTMIFGSNVCQTLQNIDLAYSGTFEEYPTIVVTGPARNISIVHASTGDKLAFDNYTIAAGEVVTFTLTYGSKTVVNNFGVSLLGELSNDSDLAIFSLQPHPIVVGGLNTLTTTIQNGTIDTSVVISYFNRYNGI